MKKILLIFLCLISVSIYADARMTAVMIGNSTPVVVGCSTASTSCTGTSGTSANIAPQYYYIASQFTASETATICAIELELDKLASPSGTFKVAIMADEVGTPPEALTPIGSWSDDYNVSALPDSYAYFTVTKAAGGLGASLTASTLYWIVIYNSLGDFRTNFQTLAYTDCLATNGIKQSDTGAWGTADAARGFHFKLYK